MEGPNDTCPSRETHKPLVCLDERQPTPFAQQWVVITKQERIELNWPASYWEAQHAQVKTQMEALKEENRLKDAKIKDLQNRLFGKKSEKNNPLKSEKGKADTSSKRKRGQQPGSKGHGRTPHPDLPVVHDEIDLADEQKCCSTCGLP
jgi:hypothetical protein